MKTTNPDIDIFETLKQAEKVFKETAAPVTLVKGIEGYFIDRQGIGEHSIIKSWPGVYNLIGTKIIVKKITRYK